MKNGNKMNSSFAGAAMLAVLTATSAAAQPAPTDPVTTSFTENEHHTFSAEEQGLIDAMLDETHAAVAARFPSLADDVSVTVVPVHRPALDALGGVTGRADRPNELLVEISVTYPGGVVAAVADGLEATFLHELHHTVRGWTMQANHYGHGIQIAAINEGLATVFAEEVLGEANPADLPPAEVEDWANEILALPRRANYGEWMFSHPDGRLAVGYRTGRWVVRRAMERSGLDIIELTDRSPAAIWAMAGFEWDRNME